MRQNRDRLLEGNIAAKFLSAVLAQLAVKKLLSTGDFSVDRTLIAARGHGLHFCAGHGVPHFKKYEALAERPVAAPICWSEACDRDVRFRHPIT